MIIRALRLRHGRIALPRSIHTSTARLSALESTVSPNAEPSERVGLPQFAAAAKETIGPNTVIDRTVPLNDPLHPVALDYAFLQHNKKYTSRVGSTIAPHYKPHELLTKPPSPRDITLEALIAAQTHIGHATTLWNPSNARYIFGVRGDHDPIHIISPDATASHLRRACKVVQGVAERGGLILFVGTRQGQARAVVKAAGLSKGCHLFTKWIPGSITNGQQILGRCEKRVYTELDEDVTEKYALGDQLFAKAALKPDLVVCLNPLENYILLHECGLNNIPTVGIIDTDANPTWVTYPIPANDDSLRAVQFICGVLGRAGQQGQEQRLRDAKPRAGRPDGFVVYPAIHGLQAPEQERSERRGTNTRVTGNARRMKVPARSAIPQAAQSGGEEEPLFPDDFDGADVQQHEKDQAMLEAAERTIFEDEMASATVADSQQQERDIVEEAEEEDESPDLSSLDQSLIDETYLPAVEGEDDTLADDAAQFGIHMSKAPPTPVNSEPASVMEQVGEVEQELGEEAPQPNVEQQGNSSSNSEVKDVDQESPREVDVAVHEANKGNPSEKS